jgi:L-lactate dehydrogenase
MPLFDRAILIDFAADLLSRAGMEPDKAAVTAEVLVEGDMIGHETHGLQLMHWYLEQLGDGSLNGSGSYEIVADKGAAFVWDGRLLPGAWLLTRALDQASARVADHGIVAAAIRNCHHTCALSA